MKEVGPLLFFTVAALLAGFFIGSVQSDGTDFDPIGSYCRGYTDAIVFVIANGAGGIAPRLLTDQERDDAEAGCASQVSIDTAPPFARGPLVPE